MDIIMDYFGSSYGYINMILFYIPLTCLLLSTAITLFVKKSFVAPILIGVMLVSFYLYAYNQMNIVGTDFIYSLIMNVFISYLASKLLFRWTSKAVKNA